MSPNGDAAPASLELLGPEPSGGGRFLSAIIPLLLYCHGEPASAAVTISVYNVDCRVERET